MELRQKTWGSWMIQRLFILGCFAALIGAMPGCTPNNNTQPILSQPATLSVIHEPPAPSPISTFPPVPAILPKPILLGDLFPAVVALPPEIFEPQIRVLIVNEQILPPRIKAELYRGRVDILRLDDGKYVAVNVLPMEDYLAGVLSRELYGSWRPAAYRAQAVAARTYALYQIETFGRTHAWDITGTENSQMYGGRNAETVSAWDAAAATRGQVLYTAEDGVIGIFPTYYSSSDGGATQSASDAWGDPPVGPLIAQPTGTLDAPNPKFSWPSITISKAQITQTVDWWGLKNHLPYLAELGPIARVVITEKNPSTGRPRIITLTDIYGHRGVMRAEEFRMALTMSPFHEAPVPPSSFFSIQDQGLSIELINGRGYGHGVGMSQWGAESMALEGMSFNEILAFYYPDSWIHRQW
jgi:stage II sporulation protein D